MTEAPLKLAPLRRLGRGVPATLAVMTTRVERPHGCLQPVQVDEVVPDPEHVRDPARRQGPYSMPYRAD